MEERGYLETDILQVLEGDAPALIYPSPREETVDLYLGCVGDKFMLIPVDRGKETIITVRPMRRNEKALFIQEVKNDKK
jgi:hypothetical protein